MDSGSHTKMLGLSQLESRWETEYGDPQRIITTALDEFKDSLFLLHDDHHSVNGAFNDLLSIPVAASLLTSNSVVRYFILYCQRHFNRMNDPAGFDLRASHLYSSNGSYILFLMRLSRYPSSLMNWLGPLNTIIPTSLLPADTWRIDYVVVGYSSDSSSTKESLLALVNRACSNPNLVREN